MSRLRRNTIGITMGDPCGIGPEVVAKALATLPSSIRTSARFLIIGDDRVYRRYNPKRKGEGLVDLRNMPPQKLRLGRPSPESARASLEYLQYAIGLLKEKKISSLVTAPVSKEAVSSLGIPFCGHTEYLVRAFKVKRFGMMFVTDRLKMSLVTRHLPLRRVAQAIDSAKIDTTLSLTHETLQKFFEIPKPRIAVCGLNPHAGEGGRMGREEVTKIIPAIQKARRRGFKVFGPFAADTLFYPKIALGYDAIVAMYHDQGLIPMKSLYFGDVVNLTMGLPFVRTSPAHGTAFDIAGKDAADPQSMREAIKLAVRLAPQVG